MKHRNIEISIDNLVLEGLNNLDARHIKASVERELTQLIVNNGVPERLVENVNIARLSGGQIGIKPGANTAPIGKQIARAIYGGIKG